jgi:hypothetical protein
MKKQVINERDVTQMMFKKLRNENILREDFGAATEEPPTQEAPQEGGETNSLAPSENDVSEAQEKFRQNVAPDTVFEEFTIYPDENNVIFSGNIPGLGKFVFEYTQKEGYAFETEGQVTMSNINFEIIKKMVGYFTNWKEEMATKLLEYKQNNG